MDWIDCFPIFVLGVIYKSSFLGHIMYFNDVFGRHPGNNNYFQDADQDYCEKYLATPFCTGQQKANLRACSW